MLSPHLTLQDIQRGKILKQVFRGKYRYNSRNVRDWSVLIVDKVSRRILEGCMSMTDIIQENIIQIDDFNSTNRYPIDKPAIYFLHPGIEAEQVEETLQRLVKDFNGTKTAAEFSEEAFGEVARDLVGQLIIDSQEGQCCAMKMLQNFKVEEESMTDKMKEAFCSFNKYRSAHVFFTSSFDRIEEVLQEFKDTRSSQYITDDIEFTNLNWEQAGDNVFLLDDGPQLVSSLTNVIQNICVNTMPCIYYKKNNEKSKSIAVSLQNRVNNFQNYKQGMQSIILVVDRGTDLITPLVHSINLESLAYDLLDVDSCVFVGKDGNMDDPANQFNLTREKDLIWKKIRDEPLDTIHQILGVKGKVNKIKNEGLKNDQVLEKMGLVEFCLALNDVWLPYVSKEEVIITEAQLVELENLIMQNLKKLRQQLDDYPDHKIMLKKITEKTDIIKNVIDNEKLKFREPQNPEKKTELLSNKGSSSSFFEKLMDIGKEFTQKGTRSSIGALTGSIDFLQIPMAIKTVRSRSFGNIEQANIDISELVIVEAENFVRPIKNLLKTIEDFKNAETDVYEEVTKLCSVIQRLPAQLKENNKLKLYMQLVQQCFDKFTLLDLKEGCQFEQMLATGEENNGEIIDKSMEDDLKDQIVTFLRMSKAQENDKIRILLLFILFRKGMSKEHLFKLLNETGLDNTDAYPKIKQLIDAFDTKYDCQLISSEENRRENSFFEDQKVIRKSRKLQELEQGGQQKRNLERWKPVVELVAHDFFKALDEEINQEDTRSLFSPVLNRMSVKDRSHMIIFIVGGITNAEISAIRKFDQMYKDIPVYLGSTKIISPKSFIEDA